MMIEKNITLSADLLLESLQLLLLTLGFGFLSVLIL